MCVPAHSPICLKWTALGGEAVLGKSVGQPKLVLDGKATLQEFEKGAIFLTPNGYGGVVLSKLVFDEWQKLAVIKPSLPPGSNLPGASDDLQKYLGCPIKDCFKLAQGGDVAYFECGMMYVEMHDTSGEFDESRQCVVYGKVYEKYRALGDVNGSLGLPNGSTRIDKTGGLVSLFDAGSIYWIDGVGTGAGVVFTGSINSRWQELSGLSVGGIGYPITDEQPVIKDKLEIGRVSRFQNGVIYWNKKTNQAFDVRAPILTAWEDQFGGAAGEFGFPISGQQKALNSNKIFNDFEGGILVWDFDAVPPNQLLAVKQLEFSIKRFAGTGGDEGPLDNDLEIYIPYTVATNMGILSQGRLPTEDEDIFYPTEVDDVGLNFAIPGVVNGKTVVAFDFEGIEDDVGPNNPLGRIIGEGNLDNGWILNLGLHKYKDDAFRMTAGIRQPGVPLDPNPEKFRGQGFWSFKNFPTDDLTTQQYADAFLDIDDATTIGLNPATWLDEAWEYTFYHVAFKDIAEKGNCFGMCVESIYGQVGRSFFNEPIFKYKIDADDGLVNEINIKHGYQCGASVIGWFINQFAMMNTHDPVSVFQDTMVAYAIGDYPVISMSNGFFKAGGHVVRPYAWSKPGENHWIISVANPNFPAPGGTPPENVRLNDAEGCIIHIHRAPDDFSSFRFENKAGDVWEGGQWVGGRMHYIPYSQLDQPVTPGSDVVGMLERGLMVILGSAGESNQISDQAGNTFYEPGLTGAPTQWQDIRRDGDTLLGNVARIPTFSGGAGPMPEIYFVRNTGATLQHRIAPRPETPPDQPYHWLMRSPTLSAAIALQAASVVEDVVTLDRAGTFDQAISVAMSPEGPDRKAEFWLGGWRGLNGENDKWFHVHHLSLAPGHVIKMRINKAGSELVLTNDGPQLICQVTVKDSNTRVLVLPAGEATAIHPTWEQLDQLWVVEKAEASLLHFMEGRGLLPQLGVRAYFPSANSIRELIQA